MSGDTRRPARSGRPRSTAPASAREASCERAPAACGGGGACEWAAGEPVNGRRRPAFPGRSSVCRAAKHADKQLSCSRLCADRRPAARSGTLAPGARLLLGCARAGAHTRARPRRHPAAAGTDAGTARRPLRAVGLQWARSGVWRSAGHGAHATPARASTRGRACEWGAAPEASSSLTALWVTPSAACAAASSVRAHSLRSNTRRSSAVSSSKSPVRCITCGFMCASATSSCRWMGRSASCTADRLSPARLCLVTEAAVAQKIEFAAPVSVLDVCLFWQSWLNFIEQHGALDQPFQSVRPCSHQCLVRQAALFAATMAAAVHAASDAQASAAWRVFTASAAAAVSGLPG